MRRRGGIQHECFESVRHRWRKSGIALRLLLARHVSFPSSLDLLCQGKDTRTGSMTSNILLALKIAAAPSSPGFERAGEVT